MSSIELSRSALSDQTGVLRATLLLSLGLSPLACGGSAITASDGGGGGAAHGDTGGATSYSGGYNGHSDGGATAYAGGYSEGGAPSYAGGHAKGGAPSSYAGAGGRATGGAPSYAGAGGASPLSTCPNPVFNPATKLIECSNGLKHRAESLECTFTLPPQSAAGAGGGPAAGGAGDAGAGGVPTYCTVDADCTGLLYGYCDRGEGGGLVMPVCRSGCVRDSDCGSGVCACNGTNPGRCSIAACLTDSDCGPNSLCAPAYGVCGPGSYQCTTPEDECIDSRDCGGGSCTVQNGHRVCFNAICGRPFLIEDLPRMASIEPRADWLDAALTPNTSGLTPVQRAQLAAHWARLGQMEHASIAAFARFNLQLLSLGAPSDLIEACNRALADETAHARACFALASSYGGSAIGPARLDITHCFEDTSLTAIAKLVLREGCLGETVASLEALAAAELASDRAVKQALERIARDELRHAELAFAFLRWALARSPLEVREELAHEAEQQLADFEHAAVARVSSRTEDLLAAHGMLADGSLRAIHLAAVRDVARPLLSALLFAETWSA